MSTWKAQLSHGVHGSFGGEFGSSKQVVGREMDEVVANAGYNVRASELDVVAQKLEQLESVVGTAQEGNILHLLNEVMHNNPADIGAWIETMIKELSAPSNFSVASSVCSGVGPASGMVAVPDVGSVMLNGNRTSTSGSALNLSLDHDASMADSHNCLTYAGKVQGSQCPPNMLMSKYNGPGGIGQDNSLSDQQWQSAGNELIHSSFQSNSISGSTYGNGGGGCISAALLQDGSLGSRRGVVPQQVGGMSRSIKNATSRPSTPHHLTELPLSEHENSHVSMMMEEVSRPLVQQGGSQGDNAQVDEPARAQEESGVMLVHLLVTCAQAVQANDMVRADEMVRQIQDLASSSRGSTGPMEKVAIHFVDALARRIYGFNYHDAILGMQADGLSEILHFQFYEMCPYLKFAHFTANQAILEAFEGEQNVHIIDFNLMHGLQWPALIQALALRPGGPPFLRLTGIGLPQPGGNDVLQEIGTKLAQLAGSVNVKFDFRGVVALKLDDVKPWMLQVQAGEAVAVNSVLQMHRLLEPHPEEVWQMGSNVPSDLSMPKALTSMSAITEVLQSVRSLNPKIMTLVEHEANHNSPVFFERFMEALHYYSTMFDSLEACNQSPHNSLAEMYLGREICNIVACEGPARVERHETLTQWQARMCNAGFQPRQLGPNAFRQASMLLSLFSAEGYSVEDTSGFLLLKWHDRPLMAASAWHCSR